jgi:peptidoglycan/xylan/chitin deacetylase (PgdA/CDA1 family)
VDDDARSASAAGSASPAAVALTFDMEHPSRADHDPQSPRRILDTLAECGVRATFFVQGRWARAEPSLAKRVVEEGHLLGCHSHFHAPLTALSGEGILTDSTSAVAALTEVTGADPRPWYRCPFGAGHDDARVLTALDRGGFTNVHWNIDTQDWVEGCSPQEIIRSVLDGVARIGDGSIVLLHSWPTATAAALPQLLQSLSQAYRLVGVDDPSFAIT